jgi:hypothetical protein
LCSNCLLKHVIEGKIERIEVVGKWGRRRKQLVVDLKEKRGYWKFKDEVLDHTPWRTHFGRGYGPKTHNRIRRMWKTHISSHALSRKCQMTTRFIGRSRFVGPLYGTCICHLSCT